MFGEKLFGLWRPMGFILKIVSDFYHLIILKLTLFILLIYYNLWIIGTACFSGVELWKMNLFSHYFINFSFTFLFIGTSIITMVTLLLLSLFSLILSVLFPFVMGCLFLLLLLLLLLLPVCLLFVVVLQWFAVHCLGLSWLCVCMCVCVCVYACMYV